MDWANTHASGMNTADPLLAFGTSPVNYYNPRNAGFWYRELNDAAWAGLQFFLINTYGPDLQGTPDQLAMLGQALAKAGPAVKVALFDDPSAWGQASSPAPFNARPNLSDTDSWAVSANHDADVCASLYFRDRLGATINVSFAFAKIA